MDNDNNTSSHTHMNEFCHTYEWVVSRVWMCHVPHMYIQVRAQNVGLSICHGNGRRYYLRCVIKHMKSHQNTCMSHVKPTNEPCHIYEGVMAHLCMIYVTPVNASFHNYFQGTHVNEACPSHIWMRHISRMNVQCQPYDWVMSHVCMGHVTPVYESCHACEWFK